MLHRYPCFVLKLHLYPKPDAQSLYPEEGGNLRIVEVSETAHEVQPDHLEDVADADARLHIWLIL